MFLADDREPMGRMCAGRDKPRQLVDVGRATGGLQLTLATELLGERDLVDTRARLIQLHGDGVDILVLGIEEVVGRDALLEAALERVAPVDHDAGNQAAFGVEVVGRHAVAVIGSGSLA